jgi:hypothetical protein
MEKTKKVSSDADRGFSKSLRIYPNMWRAIDGLEFFFGFFLQKDD